MHQKLIRDLVHRFSVDNVETETILKKKKNIKNYKRFYILKLYPEQEVNFTSFQLKT